MKKRFSMPRLYVFLRLFFMVGVLAIGMGFVWRTYQDFDSMPHEAPSIIKVIEEAELKAIMYAQAADDEGEDEVKPLRLINFWATWCRPCVAEMPALSALQAKYANQMEIVFVSVDNPKRHGKATELLQNKGIKGEHYLVNLKNTNQFVNNIDPNWSGAIPYTIFVNTKNAKKIHTYEGAFHQAELFQLVEQLLLQINP